jgi:tetratricopeptide (TPR) repeat protein
LGDLLRGIFSPGSGAAEKKDQQARAANDLGLQAYNKGDWVTAITYFNKALEKYPDDPTYRQNLAYAQTNLANQQAREKEERDAAERQRRNKAAADNMQQSIQSFAQTLNAAPVSGGLDFDGRTSGNAPTGNSGGLDFTATVTPPASDPNVAVARDVPSGLPKGLDSAIATAYSSAPPGISDRVRKGFQAVMERDWKVAKAWFQDALNRDPNNAGLKRLIALTDSPQQHDRQPATVEARNEPAGLGGGSNSNGATAPPNKTKPTTTTGTPLQAFDPNESLHIMFPGLEAMEEKEALDYLFGLDPYPPASKSAKAK